LSTVRRVLSEGSSGGQRALGESDSDLSAGCRLGAGRIKSAEALAKAKSGFLFPAPHFFHTMFSRSLCRGSSPVERGPEKAGVGSSTLPLGTS
jgi:hypothetical protein